MRASSNFFQFSSSLHFAPDKKKFKLLFSLLDFKKLIPRSGAFSPSDSTHETLHCCCNYTEDAAYTCQCNAEI